MTRLHVLNLHEGADFACTDCLNAAKAERRDELKSVAVASDGEECSWCGWTNEQRGVA